MTTQKFFIIPQLIEVVRLLGDDGFEKREEKCYYQRRVMNQLEELGNSHHIVSIGNVNCIVQRASVYYLFTIFLQKQGRPLQAGLSMAEVAG